MSATATVQQSKLDTHEGLSRILLIDDNKIHLELLGSWLEECGFSVVATNNAYDAMQHFDRECFHLVVTDICMPGMDGNLVARYIRGLGSPVPIIAVTGNPYLARECFDLVVSKPYTLQALCFAIHELLGSKPAPDRGPAPGDS